MLTELRKAHLIEGFGHCKDLPGEQASHESFAHRALQAMGGSDVELDRGLVILNGCRPFPADLIWQGPFLSGTHWGCVYPRDAQTDWMLLRAAQLDIAQVLFHSKAAVWAWAERYYGEMSIDPHEHLYKNIVFAFHGHIRDIDG